MNLGTQLRSYPIKMLKVHPAFLLAECSEMQDERDKLKQKRIVLNDFRNSQVYSNFIKKKKKLMFLVRKVCSEEKAKCCWKTFCCTDWACDS